MNKDMADKLYAQLSSTAARQLDVTHIRWLLGRSDITGFLARKRLPGWTSCPGAYAELEAAMKRERVI